MYIGKLMAMIPFYILWFMSWTLFRKWIGALEAALFDCLLIGMPSIIHIGSLIRMYSWGMLFTTITGLCIYFILQEEQIRYNKRLWCGLVLGGIAACYTHYFCCAAVFCIYMSAGIWCIIHDREKIQRLLFSAAIIALAFFPWALVLLGQAKSVMENYWIPEITWATVLDYMKFYLAPYTNAKILYLPLAVILTLVVLRCLVGAFCKGKDGAAVALLVLIMVEVTVIGISASIALRPIFVARYAIPASGLFCLGFSIILGGYLREQDREKVSTIAAVLICGMIGAIDVLSFIKNEWRYRSEGQDLKKNVFNKIQDENRSGSAAIVVTNSSSLQDVFSFFLPDTIVYVEGSEVSEYYHELALTDNMEEWNGNVKSSDLWVVNYAAEDSGWMEQFDLAGCEAIHAVSDQIEMVVYHQE